MEQSESIKQLAAAMVKAQGEIEGAAKDKVNPHFKSRYADLSSIWEACKPALNGNGIAVLQSLAPSDGGTLALETVLLHSSGEWLRGKAVVPLGKNDPQGFGSALTYARRYSLAAMVGVCPEDDDGEGAQGRGPQRRQPQQQPSRQPKTTYEFGPGVTPPEKNGEDLDHFRTELHGAFLTRGFTVDEEKAAVVAALKSFGVTRINELDVPQRTWLLQDVRQGKADKIKAGAPAESKA